MNKNQERDVSFRLPMESCEGGPVVSLPAPMLGTVLACSPGGHVSGLHLDHRWTTVAAAG